MEIARMVIDIINNVLGITFLVCYAYQFFYIIVPWFWKEKPHKETVPHKIAILVSARNEEVVIGNLVDSINKQSYDRSLITVFVVADNCDENDKTAQIARELGAVVYERQNKEKIGKGFALEFLYENIVRDFGDTAFDAYMVLDADNILDVTYVEEMNKTFSDGYEVLTSYRNSKNYGDNWITAGYGLWFIRESVYLNGARMLLGTSCAVSGTGFMFASSIIREVGGWKFFLLTEDIEFTVYNIAKGRKIGYARRAHLYDEQPTTFAQSWNQRLRWTKGYMQVWRYYGGRLIKTIFSRHFTSGYDMTMIILPALIISAATIVNAVVGYILALISLDAAWAIAVSWGLLRTFGTMYTTLFIIGLITTITQWRHIHCNNFKKILYTFTFPVFMATYIPITFAAFFAKVKWKPIKHNRSRTLEQIRADEDSGEEA